MQSNGKHYLAPETPIYLRLLMLTLKNVTKSEFAFRRTCALRLVVTALMASLFLFAGPAVATVLPENASSEIRSTLRAAHNQDVNAMFGVATYLIDESVADNDEMARFAFGWALLAARNGHPQAAELTGVMYRRGIGVPQNYVKSRKWLERALARKSMEPNFELALLYADDENPGVDKKKASIFLSDAIRVQEPRACLISARNKLKSGLELRKTLKEVNCAAEGGLVDAMEMLGDYNLQKQSPYAAVRAREWLERAADAGSETAREKLATLEAN